MLLTKLHIPAVTPNIVHRTKLFEKLSKGLNRKLLLVSAPAGYGKSTLISDWIHQQKISTVWYSLDEGDNDVSTFFEYIIKGIQTLEENTESDLPQILKASDKPANQDILKHLINKIVKLKKEFLFVFDDFHVINNHEILTLFNYFLEYIPDNIHVVVLSRTNPTINLARLRSHDQLVELNSTDLVFSENDIHTYFNKKLKINITTEDVRYLYSKTEGWSAGLQLIALSINDKKNASELIKNFHEDNRHIMDFLLEEVWNGLQDELKEFLINISFLEQFSASLCNTLLDRKDSQQVIELLESNNLFIIPLDDQRKWYRFHHLFGELLRKKLIQKEESEIKELHCKACDWFYKNSLPVQALQHSIKSENFEISIVILEAIIEELWETSHHATILKFAAEIPDSFIQKSPVISLYYAWILVIHGQIEKAEPLLLTAEQLTKDILQNESELSSANKKLSGKISVAQAYLNSFAGRPDKMLEYCKNAMEFLSEDDVLWYSWAWYSTGIAYLACDNISGSTEALKKALDYSKRSGNAYVISTVSIALAYNEGRTGQLGTSHQRCVDLLKFIKEQGYSEVTQKEWSFAVLYANMAAIEWLWCDMDKAFERIKVGYSLIIEGSDISYHALVLIIYSGILQTRGDIAGAVEKMNELEELVKDQKVVPGVESMYTAWKGIMYIVQGQFEKAGNFLDKKGIGITSRITNSNEQAFIPLVLLLLSSAKFEDAKKILTELYELASEQDRLERKIEIKIFYSIIYNLTGEKEKALTNLMQALEYSSRNGAIIYYFTYYEMIGDLLEEIFAHPQNIPASHLEKLKKVLSKREKPKNKYEGTELSASELKTLRMLVTNHSNQEIADNLFISLNTVKTHLKNIYSKLNVDSRTKAVEMAKGLGLIK